MAMTETEVFERCKVGTFELIRGITNETKEEQAKRYLNEPLYHSTIDLLIQMRFMIETNEHFKGENKRMEMEAKAHEMKRRIMDEMSL